MQQITVKLRLRDKHVAELNRQARAVSFVWNFCNDAHKHTFNTRWKWRDKWLSYKALAGLTAGSAEELDLHSHTIQRVCREYEKSRKAKKKRWLKYRGRKSLGRVPFNTGHVNFDGKTPAERFPAPEECSNRQEIRTYRGRRRKRVETG
jgi:putative transposase